MVMYSLQVENAVTMHYGIRRNMMVPNICWGIGVHECDILRVTDSRYAHEIEIKVSKQDLIADKKKRHGHRSKKIRSLTFAIPESLQVCIPLIPERAGVLLVNEHGRCKVYRKPVINRDARKLTEREYLHIGKLASMRIWGLKNTIESLQKKATP